MKKSENSTWHQKVKYNIKQKNLNNETYKLEFSNYSDVKVCEWLQDWNAMKVLKDFTGILFALIDTLIVVAIECKA